MKKYVSFFCLIISLWLFCDYDSRAELRSGLNTKWRLITYAARKNTLLSQNLQDLAVANDSFDLAVNIRSEYFKTLVYQEFYRRVQENVSIFPELRVDEVVLENQSVIIRIDFKVHWQTADADVQLGGTLVGGGIPTIAGDNIAIFSALHSPYFNETTKVKRRGNLRGQILIDSISTRFERWLRLVNQIFIQPISLPIKLHRGFALHWGDIVDQNDSVSLDRDHFLEIKLHLGQTVSLLDERGFHAMSKLSLSMGLSGDGHVEYDETTKLIQASLAGNFEPVGLQQQNKILFNDYSHWFYQVWQKNFDSMPTLTQTGMAIKKATLAEAINQTFRESNILINFRLFDGNKDFQSHFIVNSKKVAEHWDCKIFNPIKIITDKHKKPWERFSALFFGQQLAYLYGECLAAKTAMTAMDVDCDFGILNGNLNYSGRAGILVNSLSIDDSLSLLNVAGRINLGAQAAVDANYGNGGLPRLLICIADWHGAYKFHTLRYNKPYNLSLSLSWLPAVGGGITLAITTPFIAERNIPPAYIDDKPINALLKDYQLALRCSMFYQLVLAIGEVGLLNKALGRSIENGLGAAMHLAGVSRETLDKLQKMNDLFLYGEYRQAVNPVTFKVPIDPICIGYEKEYILKPFIASKVIGFEFSKLNK